MIRHVLLVAPAVLAACSPPAPAPEPQPTPTATPTPSSSPSDVTPLRELPRGLVGTWTADKNGTCTPSTERRIVVAPTTVRFYESDARITRVTQVDPHSWAIVAEATGEGETRRVSFTLNLNEDGSLTRVEAPFPDITYTRCKVAP